jgi:hypothetical protein
MLIMCNCSRKNINLTPDIIVKYGLDQMTLPKIQFYYKTITIRSDSTLIRNEPTVFRRIYNKKVEVTESKSLAASQYLDKNDIILIKNGTPCTIIKVEEDGRVLTADFNDLKLNFRLSYKTGYNFELISDTVIFQEKTYIRAHQPLEKNTGLLSVNRKYLETFNDTQIRIRGRRIEDEK